MSTLAMTDDSPRTSLAAVLSVLLHGLLAAAIVGYFWLHVAFRKPTPYVMELFPPPLASTNSPQTPGGPPAPGPNITVPSLTNLPDTKINLPTETITPPTPTPPSTPPTPPTPPITPNRGPAPPTRNTKPQQMTFEQWQARQNRGRQTGARSANTNPTPGKRSNLNVGIDTTSIGRGVRSLGGDTRGSRSGVPGGRAQDDYLARLVALLKAAFEVPPGASGMTASVELTIAANGRVVSRKITRKSGNEAFDAAVQAALNSLVFVDPPPSEQQETFSFVFQPDK